MQILFLIGDEAFLLEKWAVSGENHNVLWASTRIRMHSLDEMPVLSKATPYENLGYLHIFYSSVRGESAFVFSEVLSV